MRAPFAIVFLIATLGVPFAGFGQSEDPAEASAEEIIERILELRSELDDLMASLPEEVRDEVERRWQQRDVESQEPAPESPAQLPEPPAQVPEPPVLLPESTGGPPKREQAEAESVDLGPENTEAIVPEAEAEQVEIPSRSEPAESEPTEASKPAGELDRAPCAPLGVLDTNGDGFISGGDRYWRYLALWVDNDDGRIGPEEVQTLFDLKIRKFATRPGRYWTLKETDGDVLAGDHVDFLLLDRNAGRARLLIDADKIARGGDVRLLDASAEALTGLQPVTRGLVLENVAGAERFDLLCP